MRQRISKRGTGVEISPRVDGRLGVCLTCLGDFRPYRSEPKQRFCKTRCRRLYWAAVELASAYEAGQVPGLHDIIERLREAK